MVLGLNPTSAMTVWNIMTKFLRQLETLLTTNIYAFVCVECKHMGQSADLK